MTPDQVVAADRLFDHDETFLVASMGFGKTVSALSAMNDLINDGVCKRILVVAPLRVCQLTWSDEHLGWAHLKDMDIGICTGTINERLLVLRKKHAVTVINFENLVWLIKTSGYIQCFDGLLIDELTKLKSSGGTVFKALRSRILKFKWRAGMTGTPVSEDYEGLYGQMMMVDGGKRLGTRKDKFLERFFYPLDFNRYDWALKPNADKEILNLIKDVVHIVPEYTGALPALNIDYVEVELPEQARDIYDTMARDMLVDINGGDMEGGDTAEAPNMAALQGKLQQIANGFFYVDDTLKPDQERIGVLPKRVGVLPDLPAIQVRGPARAGGKRAGVLHSAKLDYVKAFKRRHELAWRAVKGGAGGLVLVYWHEYELAELRGLFPNAGVLGGGTSEKQAKQYIKDWNAGRLAVLILHPRSAGHGLNIAKGGHTMLWLAPCWSRDLWLQTVARLWRRGQTKPVNVTVVVARNTVDNVIKLRVEGKGDHDVTFKQHLNAVVG